VASTDDKQQAQARKQSNLALAFKLAGLDAERRRAMEVFYTFCRIADDIVDEGGSDEAKNEALDMWRATIRGYYGVDGGTPPHDDITREMAEVVRKYEMPMAPLLAIIDGCAMDIGGQRVYANAAELHRYCYGVASAVGLGSIKIFGCKSPVSEEFAVALGYALQFTNILRDVVEDYHELGRIYLPRDEMEAFGVKPEDLADPSKNPNCKRLFHLQYFRAKHYFNKARRLVASEDRMALKAAFVMGAFYEEILEKTKESNFQITRQRYRLSKWQKAKLLRRALRDLKKPMPPVARPLRVAVVGGGIAGISAAMEATLSGHIATIYESRPMLGGRASSFRHPATGVEIDYGHHAMFGCYRSFLRLVDILGIREKLDFAGRLDVPYCSPGFRKSRLKAGTTAPFHLLKALLGFSELSLTDRWAVIRFGLALQMGGRPNAGETASAWLVRLGQTKGAIRALWEPFCVAALNEPLEVADAALLEATARRTLFGDVEDSAILTSKVGLSALFTPEVDVYLRALDSAQAPGGGVRQARVASFDFSGDSVKGMKLSDGTEVRADAYILAAQWKSTASLLPEDSEISVSAKQIQGRPILNLHLFVDRRIMETPLTGLLDSPLQWVFDRTKPDASDGLYHYAITMSCPGDWMKLSTEELVSNTCRELEKFFPEAKDMSVKHVFPLKCFDATFSARPETTPLRPDVVTPWKNLVLAGDWVATGLPATIEGAAQSGQMAVQALG
jgi:squalene-associated FAD-dependent desaturase